MDIVVFKLHGRLTLIAMLCFALFSSVVIAQQPGDKLKYTSSLSKQYPDSAFLLVKNIYQDALALGDDRTLGICLQQMGEICYSQAHFAQSLDYYQQASKKFSQLKDQALLARTFNDIGIVYFQNTDRASSKKYHDQALKLYTNINNTVGVGETYGFLGHLFEKQQQYDSAFYYQRKALQKYVLAGHKAGTAKIYENLGSIFEDLGRYDSAKVYFDRSLYLYQAMKDNVGSIEVLNNLGDVHRNMGNYKIGLTYSRKALEIAIATKDEYQEAAAYRDIAKTYNLLSKNDSAYHYLELSRTLIRNIYSDNSTRQMAFLRVVYDTDKKNDEIERLENNHKTNVIIGVSAVLVVSMLVIMGLLTISRQRLKLKENLIRGEKNEQLRIAQEEQLTLKSKELHTHVLQVIQHNQFLDTIRSQLEDMIKDDKRDQKRHLGQLIAQITKNVSHDQKWKDFTIMFEQLHQSFFDDLKACSVNLTVNDIRLIALLKMNLSSKDMAAIFGISQDSLRVARYRLRKKLNLAEGDSLTSFIQSIGA
jgi:tetratricopeptide (TPR) repeat protein